MEIRLIFFKEIVGWISLKNGLSLALTSIAAPPSHAETDTYTWGNAIPISREDGFEWTMHENSHMFAYLRPVRSHEGIDLDLSDARGGQIHAIVSPEDGTVRAILNKQGSPIEARLFAQSEHDPELTYSYSHLDRHQILVKPGQSARVRKVMHQSTRIPARNPNEFRDFEVAVANGHYDVQAQVGDIYGRTWQSVSFEGIDAGTYDLDHRLAWTPLKRVHVADGKLTVRLGLRDDETYAVICELHFTRTTGP